jgi:hypothetical protein
LLQPDAISNLSSPYPIHYGWEYVPLGVRKINNEGATMIGERDETESEWAPCSQKSAGERRHSSTRGRHGTLFSWTDKTGSHQIKSKEQRRVKMRT